MKRLSVLRFLPSLILCVLLNVILFVTVPDARLGEGVFWLAWSFTFPVNILLAVSCWCYACHESEKRQENVIVFLPLLLRVILCATVLYLVLGATLMYCPIRQMTAPVVIEVVLTGIYLIVLYYVLLGSRRMAQGEAHTRAQVLRLAQMQTEVEDCAARVYDEALRGELRSLAEELRFSDPMSAPALEACEAELSAAIAGAVAIAKGGEAPAAIDEVKRARELLVLRNSRCLRLK